MKRLFTGPVSRPVFFLVSAVVTALAFWSSIVTMSQWDDLWNGGDYRDSGSLRSALLSYDHLATQLGELLQARARQGRLDYTDQQRLTNMERSISAANTNYRVELHAQDGTLIYSNLQEGEAIEDCAGVQLSESTYTWGEELSEWDYLTYDEAAGRTWLQVYLGDGEYVTCDPAAAPGEHNAYGYRADDDGEGWSSSYWSAADSRIESVTYTMQSGARWPLTVEDYISTDYENYQTFQAYLPAIATMAAVLLIAAVWCIWQLCRSAGWRNGGEGPVRSGLDRVPLDLYLLADVLLFSVLLSAGDSITWAVNQGRARPAAFVGFYLISVAGSALWLALAETLAVRYKLGHMLRDTLIWRSFAWLGRRWREAARNWSLFRRPVRNFLLYLLGTVLTGMTVGLIPVYQGYFLWKLCRWVEQWRTIREGTGRIVGGEPGFKIDTSHMYRDLREHAEQLNDLGAAIGTAVEERLKSERFKAELITNVSHDLKTPLTSIINYVDLLKKEEVQETKAREYIEVLDRKSQRLKKLTEDLVEASKAATGALTVNRERLGFTQLLDQALGEYGEEFEKSGLTPVLTTPDHELYVEADGRHLWRVLDNLLGNCVKYAMPGTRVYLDVKSWDGKVTLAVKNISRDPLNVPAEQLMERFVRGDAARTTEGSGLGLSIARSLTELQGGTFRLDIDGDLFKAVVIFPEHRLPLPLEEKSGAPAT